MYRTNWGIGHGHKFILEAHKVLFFPLGSLLDFSNWTKKRHMECCVASSMKDKIHQLEEWMDRVEEVIRWLNDFLGSYLRETQFPAFPFVK